MKLIATSILAASLALPAVAGTVSVTITNNSGDNGMYFTPFLNVVHSGDYAPFELGQTASAGLEELAEVGATGTAAGEAAGLGRQVGTLTEPTDVGDPAVGGPPVFDPGNSASFTFDLDSTSTQLTLLSMVIPSNDTFVSFTIDLLDVLGELNTGLFTVGRDSLFDAGTEVNQSFGQAFNPSDMNGAGFLGDDENGVVHASTDAELATLFGQQVPPFAGGFLTDAGDVDFNNLLTIEIAKVTPVPLPAAGWALLAALGGLGVISRRQKKASVEG